jgi:hypothetical protein
MRFLTKAKTALALGVPNLLRVFQYRLGITLGINPVKRLQTTHFASPFFRNIHSNNSGLLANDDFASEMLLFGWKKISIEDFPQWHKSYLTSIVVEGANRPWYEIKDFDEQLGDIKGVWEASRFDWVLGFAQLAQTGSEAYISKLNDWLENWVNQNPTYLGPNWKCGQEASIRIMHLAMAAKILEQTSNTETSLISLIKAHLKRIEPTLSYAIAQDNNHGTSEATALYIGGSWLQHNGDEAGSKWVKLGAKWLENRARHLIETDGSFSQHSINYHRVMLDTYSMVEVWRRHLGLTPFSNTLYSSLAAASNWLYQMVQLPTGDAPNLGTNDGARLLPLTATDFRDFRPSVQLAAILFHQAKAWSEEGSWDLPAKWLAIDIPKQSLAKPSSFHFKEGGYFGLRTLDNRAFALMTYPKFRFRPGQADALHVDFWLDGINLLRDAGSYSYNAGHDITAYFGGTTSHNTVQFDDRDQMPRLSRFLFGAWLKAESIVCSLSDLNNQQCQAAYTDHKKAKHLRKVSLSASHLKTEDTLSGFKNRAVLRWRLSPGNWLVDNHSVTNGEHTLTVSCDVTITRFKLVQGQESRYYYRIENCPVLEVEIEKSGKLTSIYKYQ